MFDNKPQNYKTDDKNQSIETPKTEDKNQSIETSETDNDNEPIEPPETDDKNQSIETSETDNDNEPIETSETDNDNQSIETSETDNDNQSIETSNTDNDNKPIETSNTEDNNQSIETSNTEDNNEPIETPSTITVTNEYIEVVIVNPNYTFYDNQYWDIVGIKPSKLINKNSLTTVKQTGGEGKTENNTTEPYGTFKYVFDYFNGFINKITESTTKTKTPLENAGLTFTKESKPYDFDIDPTGSLTNSIINPTKPKDPVGTLIPETDPQLFNTTSETDLSITTNSTPPPPTPPKTPTLVIQFSPNKNFTSLKKLMETRNSDVDIDITSDKFQYKELEKLKIIKEKKQLTTDIYVEEIYYINGKLVLLTGVLNGTEQTGTPIDLNTNISIFENTRALYSTSIN